MEARLKRPFARLALLASASAIVLACALGLGACGGGGEVRDTPDGVAAFFDDFEIREDDIIAYTQEFREAHGYAADSEWAAYLSEQGLTAKTWREQVIREKADEELVRRRADELGIEPDAERIAEKEAALRERGGVAQGDDEGWEDYLASTGRTPESLRDSLEYSSLEEQLFSAEVEVGKEERDEMCDEYIHANLADQVVRHYYAIGFNLDDEQGARECLARLSGLSDAELKDAFLAECEARGEAAGDAATGGSGGALDAGSIGWDFLFSNARIDPDAKLRRAKLGAGELYGKVLSGEDALRVVLCVEREAMQAKDPYEHIESESLRAIIADAALASHWMALFEEYLAGLEQEAHVQVYPMPEGLPYDVTGSDGADGADVEGRADSSEGAAAPASGASAVSSAGSSKAEGEEATGAEARNASEETEGGSSE